MTLLAVRESPLEVLNPCLKTMIPHAIASCKETGEDLSAGIEIVPGCILTEDGLETEAGEPYGYDDISLQLAADIIIGLSHLSR